MSSFRDILDPGIQAESLFPALKEGSSPLETPPVKHSEEFKDIVTCIP